VALGSRVVTVIIFQMKMSHWIDGDFKAWNRKPLIVISLDAAAVDLQIILT